MDNRIIIVIEQRVEHATVYIAMENQVPGFIFFANDENNAM
jgi:hypothetical protein